MYPVSQAYINALKKLAKFRRLTGTIGTVDFTEANVAEGSFQIDNQCASNGDIKLGSVFMGQLSCLFVGVDLEMGQWMGKQITVSEGLLLEDDTWEEVPLGVFTVAEANWQKNGVFVTAYDNMKLLDKPVEISTTSGTPWDILQYIHIECGIGLGQTEQEIRALPNGTRAFSLYSENDIETYRDLLYWIAQTVGCFSTIDRQGRLVLRKYGGMPVYNLPMRERWEGAQFSDYVTNYSGVSLSRIEEQDVVSVGDNSGIMYALGANPFLQGITYENVLTDILTELSNVAYTPFNVSRSGCPAFDLGDCISFSDDVPDGLHGCIMSYDYTFRGEYKITGLGANPSIIGAKSKADKEIAGLISRSNSNEMQFYTFTNAKELSLNQNYKEIIKIRFGSSRSTIVTFNAEIKCDAEITEQDVDKIVSELQYVFNGETLDYKPVETWIEGTHLLHLLYYFPVQGAAINTLSVRMKTDGAISIGRADIQAAVSGQGLVATSTWDGYIELEDEVTSITFRTTPSSVSNVSDTLTLVTHDPIDISVVSDNVVSFTFRTTPGKIADAEGEVYANKRRLADYTWEQVANEVIGAWDAYREDVTYYGGDLVYIETSGTRTEYRCTCGDGESTSGQFDASKWEVRTYNTWGDIYRLCAW